MKVRWTEPAAEQWEMAFTYIAETNPAAAEKIAGRILGLTEMLALHPLAGKAGRVAGTREFVIPNTPFILVYGLDSSNGCLWVYAIYHGAQRWPNFF